MYVENLTFYSLKIVTRSSENASKIIKSIEQIIESDYVYKLDSTFYKWRKKMILIFRSKKMSSKIGVHKILLFSDFKLVIACSVLLNLTQSIQHG
jgi:cysteinyl-tRNA synthetase